MNRRRFLAASSAAVAAPLLPDALACFLGDATEDSVLDEVLSAASAAGRPVLAFVVPRDARRRSERGHALGTWLRYADEATLVDLALVDVVCASADALRRRGVSIAADPADGPAAPADGAADAADADGSPTPTAPWMVLLPPGGGAPITIGGTLPPDAMDRYYETYDARVVEEAAADRNAALSRWLHEALTTGLAARIGEGDPDPRPDHEPTTESDEVRALAGLAAAAAPLATLERERVTRWLDDPTLLTPPDPALRRAAAWILHECRGRSAEIAVAARAALAAAAARTLRERRPPGAQWAIATGCGTAIEGEHDGPIHVACGRGRVPVVSRRFLHFYLLDGAG